jgi:hypothetical protein
MDIDTFKPTFLIQIEEQSFSADITHARRDRFSIPIPVPPANLWQNDRE